LSIFNFSDSKWQRGSKSYVFLPEKRYFQLTHPFGRQLSKRIVTTWNSAKDMIKNVNKLTLVFVGQKGE
jgi:hypothetical protein